eukprot:TRINITY_DN48384_c0_g1_i1.p1 TRINITY_DN48384_c0_g1~~TRINITY_DN48384_c0_g1_i1.p1  ORF type:complete len:354 (-),score=70.91 TRINITY_DN48384_c0_g1_i1:237-1298(-)
MGSKSSAEAKPVVVPALLALPGGETVAAAQKKLCKSAVRGATLADDREELLLKCFQEWDSNGDGVISIEEICDALGKLGVKLGSNDKAKLMAVADLNKDAMISFEELCSWLCTSPRVRQYFVLIESLHSDLLKALDNSIAKGHGERYVETKKKIGVDIDKQFPLLIEAMLDYSDKDGSGKLDEDESIIFFANFMEEMVKAPHIIEAIVGLVTHSSLGDIIEKLVNQAITDAGHDECTRISVEQKLRNEVFVHVVSTRRAIEANADLQRSAYREAFEVMDKDKDCKLCRSEMAQCLIPSFGNEAYRRFLSALGLAATDAEMRKIAECNIDRLLAEESLAKKAEATMQSKWLTQR